MGGELGLGEAASYSARLPLPNPPISDFDQAIQQPVDQMPLAHLRPFVESYDHAWNSVEPPGGLLGAVADFADVE